MELYEQLGVTEYWQFDPAEDYLRPSLKGRRLNPEGAYEPIPLARRDGLLSGWSEVLGLALRPVGHALRLFDPALRQFLPTSWEKSRIIEASKTEFAAAAARIKELEQRLGLKP